MLFQLTTTTRKSMKNEEQEVRYVPYAGIIKTVRVGDQKFQQPICTEWIDMEAGELMTAKEFKAYGIPVPAQFRYGLRMLEQEHILNTLRREVRDFAAFLMLMRNSAGGFVRSMDELMTAYAEKGGSLTARQLADRKGNLKKMVGKLIEVGILNNERMLSKLFMRLGKLDAEGVTQDDFKFHRYIRLKVKPGCSIEEKTAQALYGVLPEKAHGWMPMEEGNEVRIYADIYGQKHYHLE